MTKPELLEIFRFESKDLAPKVQEWREYLHQNPEPSFKEYKTMDFISDKLTEYGIEHQKGICGTGIVGFIKTPYSTGTIGLRADLDALPIEEKNEVHYKSQITGWMHACGHDVHSSILLGTAIILQKHKEYLKKDIKLIFQPGEEMNPGGASLMMEEGVLENPLVEAMFALHVFPELEVGNFGLKSGLYMASSDEIHIEIIGKGGHGALPNNSINPIFIGSEVLLSLKNYIELNAPKDIPTVLNFGRFEAMGSTNVIPERAIIKGTFRTMDSDWREEAFLHLERIANEVAEKHHGRINFQRSKGYPNLKNDATLTNLLKKQLTTLVGKQNVVELDYRMTAEDFAFYSSKVPICFFRLGVGNKVQGIVNSVHHPNFDVDPRAFEFGLLAMSTIPFVYET